MYDQLWRLAHPEKMRVYNRKAEAKRRLKPARRAYMASFDAKRRKQERAVTIKDIQLCARIYARAAELRQWFDVVVDHIIPLAKGGVHTANNLQIIYRKENAMKGISLSYRPVVVFI